MADDPRVGQVRLLINDVGLNDAQVFADAEISTFLDLEGGNVKLAAAQALDTIGTNELLVAKVIRTQDLQTDGAKVAAEHRTRAASLRQQAEDDADGFYVDVVEFEG